MTIQVVLTVVEIVLFVAVLAWFLIQIDKVLGHIAGTLEKIADGAKAIQGHCEIIGPGVTRVNSLLTESAGSLVRAAEAAEAL